MSALLDAQKRFSGMVALLLLRAGALGYGVTLGEACRSPEEAARLAKYGSGVANSLHCRRLAIDINLFRRGVYLSRSEDYLPLGEFWESIGGAWGGRFKRADGNHFSLEFGGVK